MANVRPAKKGNFLQPGVALEISLEQQILAEIQAMRTEQQGLREEQQGTRGQIRDMRTILMGSGEPTGETQYGRIPMLESDMREVKADVATKAPNAELQAVKADVDALKSARVTGAAHWNMARVIWALLAGSLIAVIGGGADAVISALLRH